MEIAPPTLPAKRLSVMTAPPPFTTIAPASSSSPVFPRHLHPRTVGAPPEISIAGLLLLKSQYRTSGDPSWLRSAATGLLTRTQRITLHCPSPPTTAGPPVNPNRSIS